LRQQADHLVSAVGAFRIAGGTAAIGSARHVAAPAVAAKPRVVLATRAPLDRPVREKPVRANDDANEWESF